jgi:hypothetical protein
MKRKKMREKAELDKPYWQDVSKILQNYIEDAT